MDRNELDVKRMELIREKQGLCTDMTQHGYKDAADEFGQAVDVVINNVGSEYDSGDAKAVLSFVKSVIADSKKHIGLVYDSDKMTPEDAKRNVSMVVASSIRELEEVSGMSISR